MKQVRVCNCLQCKHAKAKRKNRKLKKKIKRLINKKRRKAKFDTKPFTYYWC